MRVSGNGGAQGIGKAGKSLVLRIFEENKRRSPNVGRFFEITESKSALLANILIGRNLLDPILADVATFPKMKCADGQHRQE